LGALGDGGCITTNDFNIYKRLLKLRNYGSEQKNVNELVGHNSRLDEIQAAFLNLKLRAIDETIDRKRNLTELYKKLLPPEFIFSFDLLHSPSVFHILPVRHLDREKVRRDLLDAGIQTDIHYPTPLYQQPALATLFVGEKYPISDIIHQTVFSLPISVVLVEKDLEVALVNYNRSPTDGVGLLS
jgi:dTDP-4-amino-4,6-dideoxygalactose transaminase